MALWLPSDNENLGLWLDASDPSTITIDTGVSEWRDKSGNDRHAQQVITTRQPTVSSAYKNGLDAIKFNGVEQWMDLSATAGDLVRNVNGINLFVVQEFEYVGAWGTIFNISNTNTTTWTRFIAEFYGQYLYFRNRRTNSDGENTVSYQYPGQWGNRVFRVNYGTRLQEQRNDGYTIGTTTTGSTGLTEDGDAYHTYLGKNWPDAQYLKGSICELCVVPGEMTVEEIQYFEGYLKHKWATGSLQSGHPFRDEPPEAQLPAGAIIIDIQEPLPSLSIPTSYTLPTTWIPIDCDKDLLLWLDGTDESSFVMDGNDVVQWNDKSGNDNHAVGVVDHRPTRQVGDIGCTFDSSNYDMLDIGQVGASIAIFVSLTQETDTYNMLIHGDSPFYWILRIDQSDDQNDDASKLQFGSPVHSIMAVPYTYAPGANVWDLIHDKPSIVGIEAVLAASLTGFQIGNDSADFPRFNGKLHTLIVYDTSGGNISQESKEGTEGYLAWQLDINDELPEDHPYYEDPPVPQAIAIDIQEPLPELSIELTSPTMVTVSFKEPLPSVDIAEVSERWILMALKEQVPLLEFDLHTDVVLTFNIDEKPPNVNITMAQDIAIVEPLPSLDIVVSNPSVINISLREKAPDVSILGYVNQLINLSIFEGVPEVVLGAFSPKPININFVEPNSEINITTEQEEEKQLINISIFEKAPKISISKKNVSGININVIEPKPILTFTVTNEIILDLKIDEKAPVLRSSIASDENSFSVIKYKSERCN